MKKYPFWVVALVFPLGLLGFLSSVATAQQQQPAGVVTGVQGQAQLSRPAVAPSSLKFKDGVIIRDVVDTREKSLARILFGGRSTVTVRELSRLEVREELLPGGARRDVHDLSSGAVLVNVARQLMKPGDEVVIKTPNAVAAVRGSTVFGSFNAVLNQSFFAILSGTGTITPQGLPPVNLSANTPNNGANVSGTGATVQINIVNVPPAQQTQIIAESNVGKVVKEEAGKEQTVQAAVKEAAALANTIIETVTKTEQTGGTKTEEQKQEEQKQEQQEQASTGETTTETTTAPVTADTSSTADNPDTTVSGSKTLKGDETLKTFSGSSDRSGSSPVVKVENATVDRASTGNLIQVDSGASATLAGPLLEVVDSTITGSRILEIKTDGVLKSTTEEAFITVDPSTIETPDEAIKIGSGGTLSLKGPLLAATGTASKATKISTGDAPFLILDKASLKTGGPFLDLTNVDLDTGTEPLLDVSNGSTIENTTGPVIKIKGGSLKADALVISDGKGNTFKITGTIGDLTDTTVTLRTVGESPENDTDTNTFTLAADEPFLKMTNSTLKLTGTTEEDSLISLDAEEIGSTFKGLALIAKDSTITLSSSEGGLLFMEGTFTSESTSPLVQLTNSTVTSNSALILAEGSDTNITLKGQLLKFETTDSSKKIELKEEGALFELFDGATLKGNSSSPLIEMKGGSLIAPGNVFLLEGGVTLDLKGSLFKSDDTTIEQKSSGHGVLEMIGSSTKESTLTTETTTAELIKSTITSKGPGTVLDKSFITVKSGPLIKLTSGATWKVNTDFSKLLNGSKIEVINGPLILVTGSGSLLEITGALVNFGGTGNNKIIVNNDIEVTATKNGVKVNESSGGTVDIGDDPVKNSSLGTITQNGVVIQATDSGQVKTGVGCTSCVSNGSFETTGSIPDWTETGTTGKIITDFGSGTFKPTNEQRMAIIHTGSGASSNTTSALKQSFTPKVGGAYTIRFHGLFMSNEFPTQSTSFNDTFEANLIESDKDGNETKKTLIAKESRSSSTFKTDKGSISGGGFTLSSANGYVNCSGSCAADDAGITTAFTEYSKKVTIDTNTATLEFKIFDVGDTIVDSGILLDKVEVVLDPPLYFLANGETLTGPENKPLVEFVNQSTTFDSVLISSGLPLNGTSSVNLSGPLLKAEQSDLDVPFGILGLLDGSTLTTTSTDPLVWLNGGSYSLGTEKGTAIFDFWGTQTAVEPDTGAEVGSGKTVTHAGPLLEASGGATVNTQKVLKLDTALLEATAPIISLIGSPNAQTSLTTQQSTIDLIKAKVTSTGPVVAMDKSFINVTNGPLINLTHGSNMKVTGDLISMYSGSKINVVNGPLISVAGAGSLVDVSGALVNFGGTGGNKIVVNNSISPTATLSGLPVSATYGGSVSLTNPIKNPSLGSISVSGSLISAANGGTVNVNGK